MGRWEQLNVALRRDPQGSALASARAVFDELEPLLTSARSSRRLRCFFFMRKPPDLRLRFEGAVDPSDAEPVPGTRTALRRLVRAGRIERWSTGAYEPETRKFGGPWPMAAVHQHFDADTCAWMALDRLARNGPVPAAVDVCGALACDLFARTLSDAHEIWDTWCNVHALAVGSVAVDPTVGVGSVSPVGSLDLESLLAGERPDVVRALAGCKTANRRLAVALNRADAAGRLVGRRATLALLVQYDLNRWGLDGAAQKDLAISMAAAWHPARGLIGGHVAGAGRGTDDAPVD